MSRYLKVRYVQGCTLLVSTPLYWSEGSLQILRSADRDNWRSVGKESASADLRTGCVIVARVRVLPPQDVSCSVTPIGYIEVITVISV